MPRKKRKKKHTYVADHKKPLKGSRAPRRKKSGVSSYGVAFREGAAESRFRKTRAVRPRVSKA